MKKSKYERALETEMSSRFEAVADDKGRPLTDEEVVDNAKYYLDMLPNSGYERAWIRKAMAQMRRLIK